MTHDLLDRAIARDRLAVRAFIGAATPIIQARVTRVVLRRGAARALDLRQEVLDLTQQVFVALFSKDSRQLRMWDPERGLSLANFIGMIAEREAISALRRRKKSLWADEHSDPDEVEESAESARGPERIAASKEALSAILERLRGKLSDRGLQLFEWLYVEGRSVEEVCSEAEMSADAVYAWRSRLARLARETANEVMSDPAPLEPKGQESP